MRPFAIAVIVLPALLALTSPAAAQDEEPQTHIVSVTTFQVPYGEDLQKFWEVVDKYIVPSDKENPNILSERLASHNWGDSKKTVWFITEYKDLAGIQASDKFNGEWFDKHYPEGSAARDSADAAFNEHFLRHFSDHSDNLLTANLKRVK